MEYTVKRTDDSVLTIQHAIRAGWEHTDLLLADVHFDSAHCNRKLLKRLLDEAKEKGAGIFICGDWNDVMQGRDDRRSDKDELRKEYKVGHYLDAICDDSVAFLEPYRDNILALGDGNHETSILRHHETNILGRVCHALNVPYMGYAGFLKYMFAYEQNGKKSGMSSIPLWFHHGAGGGGEVTKGAARAQREMGPVPDARIYIGGHIHRSWRIDDRRLKLTQAGKVRTERTLHLCIPTLKDEFNLFGGYHVEKGRWPRVIGGYWLKFWWSGDSDTNVEFDAHLAI
jgi:hypothetical protein